jgi:hypothetical protein
MRPLCGSRCTVENNAHTQRVGSITKKYRFEPPSPGVSAAIARGKRPVTFRTRKLRLFAPMVLQGGPCGRVGHRRTSLSTTTMATSGWPLCVNPHHPTPPRLDRLDRRAGHRPHATGSRPARPAHRARPAGRLRERRDPARRSPPSRRSSLSRPRKPASRMRQLASAVSTGSRARFRRPR